MSRERSEPDARIHPGSRWIGGGQTVVVLSPDEDNHMMIAAVVERGQGKGQKVLIPPKEFGARLVMLEDSPDA